MQQLPQYMNDNIFSDADIMNLFVSRVRNYLANHGGNKRHHDETISANDMEWKIPPFTPRPLNTIRTEFANLQDLQEYLCIPQERKIWDPLNFPNPTCDELMTMWPHTTTSEVLRSRSTRIYTCLSHIQNMLYFCSEVPPGFRFTVCDGTYGFLKDNSVVIAFCCISFRKKDKVTGLTRSAYPLFYVVCPGRHEAAICLKTGLIHAAVSINLVLKLYEIARKEWRELGLVVFADHFEKEYGPDSGNFQWYLACTGLPALVCTTSPLEGIWPDMKGRNKSQRSVQLNLGRQRFITQTLPAILRKDHVRTFKPGLMLYVPRAGAEMTHEARVIAALYRADVDVIVGRGSYVADLYPKTMTGCTRFWLVNRPKYVGICPKEEDINLHKEAIHGRGYGSGPGFLFQTKEAMNTAANRFCVVVQNTHFAIGSLTYLCNCRYFLDQWCCWATLVVRDMENDFDGLLHEAYMPAAEQSRSRQRLRPRLPGRSELSTIGRDTLSTYVFNRSIKQIQNILTMRGINSPGTGSGVYQAGSLLMCRTRL